MGSFNAHILVVSLALRFKAAIATTISIFFHFSSPLVQLGIGPVSASADNEAKKIINRLRL